MRISVSLLSLLLWVLVVACSSTGPVIEHINTEDSGQVVDRKGAAPDGHGYPQDRKWPAKWEQWHRFATYVTCNINKEGYKACEYTLCTGKKHANNLQNGYGVGYAGTHKYPGGVNRYYYTHCQMTRRDHRPSSNVLDHLEDQGE